MTTLYMFTGSSRQHTIVSSKFHHAPIFNVLELWNSSTRLWRMYMYASLHYGLSVFQAIFILMLLGWLFVPVYIASGVSSEDLYRTLAA